MGLRKHSLLAVALIPFCLTAVVNAAPKLRLSNSVVGPVWVNTGKSGGTPIIQAYNAGDGGLSLSVSSSASWAAASILPSLTCSALSGFTGACVPIQIALNTGGLSAGTYTAVVTVRDPKAVDAPQTITVTVRVGNNLDVYVAPGSSRDIPLATSGLVGWNASTNDGGRWLSLSLDGTGSFRFSYPYRIHLDAFAGMGEGSYTGSLAIAGSPEATDNKTVPVTMRITSQPIAQPSSESVRITLAQGAPSTYWDVYLTNAGQGSLTQQGISVHGDTWLKAAQYPPNLTRITVDPGTLQPGAYTGTVDIASNAVNGAITIPVEFTVTAKAAPAINFGGVVDNAIGTAPVARGDIVVVYGQQFYFGDLKGGPAPPLATQIDTTRVLFNGKPAPMYYAGYAYAAVQVPFDVPLGTNFVQVERDGVAGNTVSVEVVDSAPRILLIGPYAAAENASDGYSLPMPTGYVQWPYGTRPAHPGDWLQIFAIGLGPTTVQVASGAAAPVDPLPWLKEIPTVNFGGGIGGARATPFYAGLAPQYAGLYQINVQIPPNSPRGDIDITLGFSTGVSNSAKISVQ